VAILFGLTLDAAFAVTVLVLARWGVYRGGFPQAGEVCWP
jgi:hypothetical protein